MRLIDADALKRKPELLYGLTAAITEIQFLIEEAPTVEERKHGHWIEHPEHPIGDCSVCGERVPIYSGSKKYKICPYCGAKMDGKEGEEE
jgi:hypothetical protein